MDTSVCLGSNDNGSVEDISSVHDNVVVNTFIHVGDLFQGCDSNKFKSDDHCLESSSQGNESSSLGILSSTPGGLYIMGYPKASQQLPMIEKPSLFFYDAWIVGTIPGHFQAHSQVTFAFIIFTRAIKSGMSYQYNNPLRPNVLIMVLLFEWFLLFRLPILQRFWEHFPGDISSAYIVLDSGYMQWTTTSSIVYPVNGRPSAWAPPATGDYKVTKLCKCTLTLLDMLQTSLGVAIAIPQLCVQSLMSELELETLNELRSPFMSKIALQYFAPAGRNTYMEVFQYSSSSFVWKRTYRVVCSILLFYTAPRVASMWLIAWKSLSMAAGLECHSSLLWLMTLVHRMFIGSIHQSSMPYSYAGRIVQSCGNSPKEFLLGAPDFVASILLISYFSIMLCGMVSVVFRDLITWLTKLCEFIKERLGLHGTEKVISTRCLQCSLGRTSYTLPTPPLKVDKATVLLHLLFSGCISPLQQQGSLHPQQHCIHTTFGTSVQYITYVLMVNVQYGIAAPLFLILYARIERLGVLYTITIPAGPFLLQQIEVTLSLCEPYDVSHFIGLSVSCSAFIAWITSVTVSPSWNQSSCGTMAVTLGKICNCISAIDITRGMVLFQPYHSGTYYTCWIYLFIWHGLTASVCSSNKPVILCTYNFLVMHIELIMCAVGFLLSSYISYSLYHHREFFILQVGLLQSMQGQQFYCYTGCHGDPCVVQSFFLLLC